MKKKKTHSFAQSSLGLLLAVALVLTSFPSINILAQIADNGSASEQTVPLPQPQKLIGFEGEYALQDDDSPVSVIVLFNNEPAAVQEHLAQIQGRPMARGVADHLVEADHYLFRQELSSLFGPVPFGAEPPFEIVWEFRIALNGVNMVLPSNMVPVIAGLSSVSAIFPDFAMELDIHVAQPAASEPTGIALLGANQGPWGMRPGRVTMRANMLHEQGYTGEGVVVAVLDTGIYRPHAAFEGVFLTLEEMQARNPNITAVDTIDGIFYGRNFFTAGAAGETRNDPSEIPPDPRWPADPNPEIWRGYTDHGTSVAGIIVGQNTNRPHSIEGIAPDARMFVYRMVTSRPGSQFEVVIGLGGAVAAIERTYHDRADVVNMSFGNRNHFTAIFDTSATVNNVALRNPNMVFIASAGNERIRTASARDRGGWFTVTPPAGSSRNITVANTNLSIINTPPQSFISSPNLWQTANDSSRGPMGESFEISPDISAPGAQTWSAVPHWSNRRLAISNYYGQIGGTSSAAPHVAGAAALLIEFSRENGIQWTAEEIKTRLMNQAFSFGSSANPLSAFEVGAGYIDVYAAAYANTVVYVAYDRVVQQHPSFGGTWLNQNFGRTRTGSFSFGGLGSLNDMANPTNQLTLLSSTSPNVRTLAASIHNYNNHERTYIIEHAFISNPNNVATITLSQREFTIAPNSTADFTATMSVGGVVQGGFYEGHVIVRYADTNAVAARLPFALAHGNVTTGINVPSVNVPASLLSFELNGSVDQSASFDPINILHGTNILDFLGRNYRSSYGPTYLPYHGGFVSNPTRSGYTFRGWYLDSNFTTRLTNTTTMPAANTTLYARWEVGTAVQQLTFHAYSGTNAPAPVVIPVVFGEPLNISTSQLADIAALVNSYIIPEEIAFWGWFTNEELNNNGGRPLRRGHRRPYFNSVGFTRTFENFSGPQAWGFNEDTIITTEWFKAHEVDGNVDLFAIRSRWGDVNDDDFVCATDVEMLRTYIAFSHLEAIPIRLNRSAADVLVDGTLCVEDHTFLWRYNMFPDSFIYTPLGVARQVTALGETAPRWVATTNPVVVPEGQNYVDITFVFDWAETSQVPIHAAGVVLDFPYRAFISSFAEFQGGGSISGSPLHASPEVLPPYGLSTRSLKTHLGTLVWSQNGPFAEWIGWEEEVKVNVRLGINPEYLQNPGDTISINATRFAMAGLPIGEPVDVIVIRAGG